MSFGKDLPVKDGALEEQNGATKIDITFEKAGNTVLSFKKKVVIISDAIVVLMVPGILKNHVNMDMLDMMETKIPYIKRLVEISENPLGTMYSYNVFIETDEEDYFKNPENMKNLDVLQKKLGTLSMTKVSGNRARVSSISETVKEMNGKLVWGELKSFAVSFLLILIFMVLAFSSITTGLIGMIPNVAPVILIGGVMGFLHIPLDMLTMMIMPMILGIAVDDTIHFNNHVKFNFEKTGNYKKSILVTFREIGKTMGMTTVILCSMFLVQNN